LGRKSFGKSIFFVSTDSEEGGIASEFWTKLEEEITKWKNYKRVEGSPGTTIIPAHSAPAQVYNGHIKHEKEDRKRRTNWEGSQERTLSFSHTSGKFSTGTKERPTKSGTSCVQGLALKQAKQKKKKKNKKKPNANTQNNEV